MHTDKIRIAIEFLKEKCINIVLGLVCTSSKIEEFRFKNNFNLLLIYKNLNKFCLPYPINKSASTVSIDELRRFLDMLADSFSSARLLIPACQRVNLRSCPRLLLRC